MNPRRYTHREKKDADLAEEIESHLAHEQDANTGRGLPSEEARRQARLKFGNPRSTREAVWRYRSLPWLDDAWRDFRFALRSLAKTPGFALIAIAVIAVGIGANTAVFSVINTVLLKPLTYPDPQSLVMLMNSGPRGTFPGANVPKFNIWRQQTSIFSVVAAYDRGGAGLNLTGGSEPEQIQGVHVSAGYFRLFGAPLAAGRTFTAAEDSPNGGRVVVLSYGLWKRRYGANPSVIGRTIQLDNQPYLVVGVIGRGFVTEAPADLWLPWQFDMASHDMAHYFVVSARLRPGVTIPSLMLIRATARKRELATRSALGAGRWQIVRQLLIESLTLSLTGGVLGLILGFTGVRLLLAIAPGGIPRIGEDGSAVTLDAHVLLFTLGVSVLTGILFGLVPALSASRPNLAATLNESSSRSGVGFRSGRIRSLLVISEMALALILVIGAALFIRTFMKLQGVDPGFDPHNVLTLAMSVSGDRFRKTASVEQVIRAGTERLASVPGVAGAAAGNGLPLQGAFGMSFDVVGRPKGNTPFTGIVGYYSVSWNYFDTFRIPLLRGRSFTDRDDGSAPGVVIINEAMAKQYWPKGDPLGDRLQKGVGAGPVFAEPPRQIIGIVGDTRDEGLNRDAAPTMYIPIAQMPDAETVLNARVVPLWWVIRSNGDPHALAAPVTAALREASGGLPVAHVRTMDEVEVGVTSRQRFNMLLLTVFGLSGLLMAAIGIYGLMAYSVQQRTQEMGIRMALGAQASNIRNMVIRQGMFLAVIGVALGIGGAFWLTRFIAGFLFGVKAWDPLAFIATPLLLCCVALFAVWIPARRATRVDPMTALRFE
ncbi:ABC transporter permease [Paracidobacterium acidisoli]|uniref:ABC transporter permease n=1 Tax=Paracidobacterium acidisoli TaxID=2303751 RepID=A0A372IMM2_9BACT|nr:ABC transporter permease [Paracidobacterium acidisoli]